jgi:uncharacterized protein
MILDRVQAAVAERVLAEEGARRQHIVVALSGAHAYGFPSPDSDLDLKAIHVEPTSIVLGLSPWKPVADRLEIVDGVEVDYTSNEIGGVLLGIIGGNGNYVERVLGRHLLVSSTENEALAPIVKRALSKRLHRHYHGFATSQLHEVEARPVVPAKKVLYVLRTALTGAHVLRTGEVVADVTDLLDAFGFEEARALVEAKKAGERAPLEASVLERWKKELLRAFEVLDRARETTSLPDEASNRSEIEAWLLALRRRMFTA